jgi:hypothetical protein
LRHKFDSLFINKKGDVSEEKGMEGYGMLEKKMAGHWHVLSVSGHLFG